MPIQTSFHWLFTSQESGEVNKQVLVFNCGPLIALPSSVLECSAPPFTVHPPVASITSRSVSPLPACALLLSCLVQQLIRLPRHPFLFPFRPSAVCSAEVQNLLGKFWNKSCTNHLMICHFASIDWGVLRGLRETVLYLLVLLVRLHITFKHCTSMLDVD